MKLGFARKDITPDFPVPLTGYYAENRISEGIHDKLYVRVLYFDGGTKKPVVLLQLDLLNLDNLCLEKLYKILEEKKADSEKPSLGNDFHGIDRNCFLVCATHTHSGFGGIFNLDAGINRELIPLLGENNPLLVELVVNKCVEAIAEAKQNCTETKVRINTGIVEGLGTNRRRSDIPCDNSLFIMEFYRNDHKKILLYSLCCHPTVLNSENRLISADFPGSVAEKLEENPGFYDMAVFINGSAGDMSTRFTRKESSFDECNRYASIIISAIDRLKTGVFLPLENAELEYHSLPLRPAEIPENEKARAHLEKARQNLAETKNSSADSAAVRKAESMVEGAFINEMKSRYVKSSEKKTSKNIEMGIMKVNTTTIVCSPFELFSSLALMLKEKKCVECFGYINCLEGYLADTDAWDNLDYEALSSDFMRGEGEHYIEMVSALV